jgi:hypothetical protein
MPILYCMDETKLEKLVAQLPFGGTPSSLCAEFRGDVRFS